MAILYPTATEFRKMLADKKTFLADFLPPGVGRAKCSAMF